MKHISIDLTYDQIDMVVVKELRDCYRINAKPIKIDCSDDCLAPDEELLLALDTVLSYYQNQAEKQEWNKEKEKLVMSKTEWIDEATRGVDYHGKQKEALDFAVKALEGFRELWEPVPPVDIDNEWWTVEDILEKVKEILK